MYQNPYNRLKPKTRQPYTEVYLIRHCNPDYSKAKQIGDHDMPLSAAGLKQRRYLSKHLIDLKINRLYASRLLRSQQTAAIYAKKIGREIIIDSRLDEIDWKDWHRIKYFNVSEKKREKKLKGYLRLDQELSKMQTIARRALADIYRSNRGQKVAIFSHGNFIKALLSGILNTDVIGFLSLEIFQSSVSKLVIDRDGYIKINYINDASHLPIEPKEDLFLTLVS